MHPVSRADSRGLYNLVLAYGRAGFRPNIVQQAPEVTATLNFIADG